MKNKIIIIGSKGGAKNAIEVLELDKKNKIVGLIDDYREIGETTFEYPIIGKINDIPDLVKKYNTNKFFIAIGDNYIREMISYKVEELCKDVEFVNVIHPSVHRGKETIIGRNAFIMANVSIDADVWIGEFVNIYPNTTIGQTSNICSFASLSTGVNVGGRCNIGAGSFLGIGSTIKHETTIYRNVVIGAHSLVLKDIEKDSLAYGVPAKIIRKRKYGEKYL